MPTAIRDRRLDDRSKLVFEFPQEKKGDAKFIVTLPFFENIRITEKKRANYKKYNLLSRSSQLYTYLGSDSRKFSLEFHMSFPHILEEHGPKAVGTFRRFVDSENPESQRDRFSTPAAGPGSGRTLTQAGLRGQAAKERAKFKNLLLTDGISTEALNTVLNGVTSVLDGVLSFLPGGGPFREP